MAARTCVSRQSASNIGVGVFVRQSRFCSFLLCVNLRSNVNSYSSRQTSTYSTYSTRRSQIFKMCIQRDPYNWSEAMYERYTHAILDYLNITVKRAFEEAKKGYDVVFLKEWKQRWHNQKLIVKGLSKLFMYLVSHQSAINCFALLCIVEPFVFAIMCCFVHHAVFARVVRAFVACVTGSTVGELISWCCVPII